MMSATELQERIINRLRHINNNDLLFSLSRFTATEIIENIKFDSVSEAYPEYAIAKNGKDAIREQLFSRIVSISDELLLSEMISLIDQNDKTIFYTTPEQKARIKAGQEQIAKGHFFTNEQVEKEIDEWINKG